MDTFLFLLHKLCNCILTNLSFTCACLILLQAGLDFTWHSFYKCTNTIMVVVIIARFLHFQQFWIPTISRSKPPLCVRSKPKSLTTSLAVAQLTIPRCVFVWYPFCCHPKALRVKPSWTRSTLNLHGDKYIKTNQPNV